MEHLGDVVSSGKNGFEKLVEKIPGIKGYKAKEDRRSTDKIVRETIAARMEEQWARIGGLQKKMLKAGQLSQMSALEEAALKIRQFIDRIKTATYGYAGLFDAVKVDETALNRIYDYDLYLYGMVDEAAKRIDAIESAMGGDEAVLDGKIDELTNAAAEIIIAFNRRSEIVQGTAQQ